MQVGAFREKSNADALAANLKTSGRSVFVTKSADSAAGEKKSAEEVAKEVIRGLWGNGAERKRRLADAGYDFSAVQTKVNEMLK